MYAYAICVYNVLFMCIYFYSLLCSMYTVLLYMLIYVWVLSTYMCFIMFMCGCVFSVGYVHAHISVYAHAGHMFDKGSMFLHDSVLVWVVYICDMYLGLSVWHMYANTYVCVGGV